MEAAFRIEPMKLVEIKRVLETEQIRLTKSLGQNFLHDKNQLQRIADAAELSEFDSVLEIGPGLGSLTEFLLEKGSRVLAVEKDERLFEFLQRKYAGHPRLDLVHADAVDYLRNRAKDWSGWKCASNLPYSAASPILVELSQNAQCPLRIVATLQAEVAQRIKADHGGRDFGILTLLVQANFQPNKFFRIPPSCFFPPPKVDSTCIVLDRRTPAMIPPGDIETFGRVVKQCFSQRRKMMLKLLKADWNPEWIDQIYRNLKLDPRIRAEAVSLDQFARITQELNFYSRKTL